jgi:hypothetical protein
MPLTADGTFRGTGPSGDGSSWLTTEYISASCLDLDAGRRRRISGYVMPFRRSRKKRLPVQTVTGAAGCLAVGTAGP